MPLSLCLASEHPWMRNDYSAALFLFFKRRLFRLVLALRKQTNLQILFFLGCLNGAMNLLTLMSIFRYNALLELFILLTRTLREYPLSQCCHLKFYCEGIHFGGRFPAAHSWDERNSTASFLFKLSRQLTRPITCSGVHRSRRDVGFEHPFMHGAVLSFIMKRASKKCVAAVLDVGQPIDYSVVDKKWQELIACYMRYSGHWWNRRALLTSCEPNRFESRGINKIYSEDKKRKGLFLL